MNKKQKQYLKEQLLNMLILQEIGLATPPPPKGRFRKMWDNASKMGKVGIAAACLAGGTYGCNKAVNVYNYATDPAYRSEVRLDDAKSDLNTAKIVDKNTRKADLYKLQAQMIRAPAGTVMNYNGNKIIKGENGEWKNFTESKRIINIYKKILKENASEFFGGNIQQDEQTPSTHTQEEPKSGGSSFNKSELLEKAKAFAKKYKLPIAVVLSLLVGGFTGHSMGKSKGRKIGRKEAEDAFKANNTVTEAVTGTQPNPGVAAINEFGENAKLLQASGTQINQQNLKTLQQLSNGKAKYIMAKNAQKSGANTANTTTIGQTTSTTSQSGQTII